MSVEPGADDASRRLADSEDGALVWNPQRPSGMRFDRYRPVRERVSLPDASRLWPSQHLTAAPLWVPVDLRDGNQALPAPMDHAQKRELFEVQVALGFKEIEVGYPSSSSLDFDFVRALADGDLVPDDVTVVVFTPARADLIERTFAALPGLRRVVVHLCVATAPLWRDVVLGYGRPELRERVLAAARLMSELAAALTDSTIRFQFSPEAFNLTELDFVLELCDALTIEWDARPERPVIYNLPSTVETSTPNVFADQVEWMHRRLARRESIILSVHPHNDRGTAVAAAELALLAGAQRVEGCLFGNGERTGNVDLVTLALNLLTQGVDPQLDLRDLAGVQAAVERATGVPVPVRHPYAGDLVFTAFSGTHQDAIGKGLAQQRRAEADQRRDVRELPWEVPYLPLDPADVGRAYDAVIRVNSQSGKGGVSYVLSAHYGLELPVGLRREVARWVQVASEVEAQGGEMTPEQVWAIFAREYLDDGPGTGQGMRRVSLTSSGEPAEGAVDQIVMGLRSAGIDVSVLQRHHHRRGLHGWAAYVEVSLGGEACWGVALAESREQAVVGALQRAVLRRAPDPVV